MTAAAIVWVSGAALRATHGRLVYAADDAYTHMAIASNVARHGVWGVTRYGFDGAGASIAWPLLLAVGARSAALATVLPLALNVVMAIALLAIADRTLSRYECRDAVRALALSLIAIVTPLATLVALGMEHTLQATAALALTACGVRALTADGDEHRRWTSPAAACAAVALASRYDTASVVVMISALLAVSGRRGAALAVAAAGAAPMIGYALVSVGHGWPPVPSPVIVKHRLSAIAGMEHPLAFGAVAGLAQFAHESVLAVLIVGAVGRLALGRATPDDARWAERRGLAAVFVGASAMHAQFATFGALFRYESYLLPMGIVAVFAAAPPHARDPARRRVAAAAAIVLTLVCARRALAARDATLAAVALVQERYEPLGRFFAEQPPDGGVALAEIGVVAYSADVPLLDLGGLATRELTASEVAQRFDARLVGRLARERGVRVAVGAQPIDDRPWPCVAAWTRIDSADTPFAEFFASDAAAAASLARALDAFDDEAAARGVLRAPCDRRLYSAHP